jgi:glutamine synthetase
MFLPSDKIKEINDHVPGTWQHKTHPISEMDEDVFKYGTGFDGSSIRGFQGIEESDMLLMPDPTTVFVDPFIKEKTISITCDVVEPDGFKPYANDPRYIAKKAEKYLIESGIADTSYMGPELEFFIFDHISFDVMNPHNCMGYAIDSNEGIWNASLNNGTPNLGHRPRFKEGYSSPYPRPTPRLTSATRWSAPWATSA